MDKNDGHVCENNCKFARKVFKNGIAYLLAWKFQNKFKNDFKTNDKSKNAEV